VLAQALAQVTCGIPKGRWECLIRKVFERGCKELSRSLIAALRQRYPEFTSRTPVHSRGTTRTRPDLPGQAAVSSLEQARFGQPIQVERRKRARDLHSPRCLLAPDRARLRDYPVVETAAGRFIQQAQRPKVIATWSVWHAHESITPFHYR
jgi:hypothetical protein